MRGTALCAAIEARNCDIAKYLINAGCDVNARDYDGEPPLLLALRKEKPLAMTLKKAALDIAKILIQNKKCDVNKVDPLTKKTAIHFATEQGMDDVIDWLLKADCDLNKTDANGNTALHLAVHDGHYEIVKKLVADSRCLIKFYNSAGLIPIHIACNNGNLKCLQALIEQLKMRQKSRGAHEEIEGIFDKDSDLYLNINAETKFEKDTCLHLAARNLYGDICKELLKNGANVNFKNNLGQQPLILACSANDHWAKKDNTVPKILLNAGANPNIKGCIRNRYLPRDTETTPLIMAARNDNLEFAKILLQKGADVGLSDNLGQSAIYHALWENSVNVARLLLTECPDINVNFKDHEGKGCLNAVLKCSRKCPGDLTDLVKAIFRAGGELPADYSPLIEAVSYENVEVLNTILDETDVNTEEIIFDKDEGFNLFQTSIGLGNIELARTLLSHGDNIDIPTNQGESPFRVALKSEMIETAEFLLSNGCDLKPDEDIIKLLIKNRDANKDNPKAKTETEDESDDDDSDDDDYIDDGNESDTDIVEVAQYYPDFIKKLHDHVTSTRSLKLLCLMTIRKYFRQQKIRLKKVESLPIAEAFKLAIRYKNT